MYRRGRFYYPYSYPNYNPSGKGFLAVDGSASSEQTAIKTIAKIIVDNEKELKDELVQLGLACSCTIDETNEKDLSVIVIDNIDNNSLRMWFAKKLSAQPDMISALRGSTLRNMIANKSARDKYRTAIGQEAVNYKATSGGDSKLQPVSGGMPVIIGVSLLLVGAYAISRIPVTN